MDFALSEEHEMIVKSARAFVEEELYPHEDIVEKTDEVPPEIREQIKQKALEMGFYAVNMPEELGGGGLDAVSLALFEREFGRANMALQYCAHRPSNILQACVGEQREKYLMPTITGEKVDCLAMTEPEAGSDVRSMKTFAKADGDDFVINGLKHFISHADVSDFVILFVATGEDDTPRGKKKRITCFLVDHDTPGFAIKPGYHSVSHRGYHNCILEFDNCRVHKSQVLGEVDKGFEVANDWLGATRLQIATTCVGRAQRAFELALDYAASRKQFGQAIGKFQGVSFKLADMRTRIELAELITLKTAWKQDMGIASDEDFAMAKVVATEMLAFVSDEAIQIFGGMGLMSDLPLERIWRDSRVERIYDGTSEIQRHIISRALLRPLEAR